MSVASESRGVLLRALDSIKGTGVFCATDRRPFFIPELMVDGVGEIGFPLSVAQAGELRSVAEAAPYGKGMRTLTDESVRKCWQIDASRIRFEAAGWREYVESTVAAAAEALGVEGKVAAEPYKLLLYEKGGHFLPHRDTEKLDAMFGTLIIALPSAHAGGRLRVRHAGQEEVVDFSGRERRTYFQSAAFFADCEHEVEPVEDGIRFCLVYNLRLVKGGAAKLQRSSDEQVTRLVPALRGLEWRGVPAPAAVLLEHRYTEANFSLALLKGDDGARARALLGAAHACGLMAHLALVTFHRVGDWPDGYDDGYSSRWRRRGGYEPLEGQAPAAAMGEVYEESLLVSHWRDARDQPALIDEVLWQSEWLICPPDLFAGDPDESESEGFTGNAGCTMEHWYRRAAVVLWPREQHEVMLCSLDFDAACAHLHGQSLDEAGRRSPGFRRLLDEVIGRLPDALPAARSPYPPVFFREESASAGGSDEVPGGTLRLVFAALANSKETGKFDELAGKLPPGALGFCDAATWKKLLEAFGMRRVRPVMESLLGSGARECRFAAFTLLAGLMDAGLDSEACRLALRLAGLPPLTPPATWPGTPKALPGDAHELAVMLRAGHLLKGQRDAQKLADFILGDRSLPYLREKFLPSLAGSQGLASSGSGALSRAARLAVQAALVIFEREAARSLAPFPDWTRPCPLPSMADSSPSPRASRGEKAPSLREELLVFMADPVRQQHIFSRPQAQRDEIMALIKGGPLDLDAQTVRSGSPHKLVCTKNSASYQRAVNQRAQDLEHLKRLESLLG